MGATTCTTAEQCKPCTVKNPLYIVRTRQESGNLFVLRYKRNVLGGLYYRAGWGGGVGGWGEVNEFGKYAGDLSQFDNK